MASKPPIRRIQKIAGALALLLLAAAHVASQTAAPAKSAAEGAPASNFEDFTATTVNIASGAGDKLSINIFHWSSDEERNRLLAAAKQEGANGLLSALQAIPTVGYVWTDESLGYAVHYAFHQPTGNGGERIILATDRPLGSWSGHPWAAKTQRGSTNYPFTLIELRLNGNGRGEGKMSVDAKISASDSDKTIMLENFEAAPVLLKNVQREARRAKE